MFRKSVLSASILLAIAPSVIADETKTLEEVVVTATRTNSQLEDTAASVAVLDDEEIEQNMVTDLDDLFEYTPGVSVETNSRQGVKSINIRGIDGNRIKVLVDGVAQGNEFESGAQFINSSRVEIDLDLIKSVQVVKGAASSLQGSNAIGGIVAFETKTPADILKNREIAGLAKFNYSSKDKTFSETVALANQFGNLESLVAFTRRDGKELRNFGEPEPQDSETNNVLVKLNYQLNDEHRIEFSGNYLKKDAQTTLPNANYGFVNYIDVV